MSAFRCVSTTRRSKANARPSPGHEPARTGSRRRIARSNAGRARWRPCAASIPALRSTAGLWWPAAAGLCRAGAGVGQLAVGGGLRADPARPVRHFRGRATAVSGLASLGQRRTDGGLLLRCRTRDQARVSRRRTGRAAQGDAADRSRRRGHGGAGADLRRLQCRRRRCPRLGHPDGHRHRLRARGAGGPRLAHPRGIEGLPGRAGDRRRPRRAAGHRNLLHRVGPLGWRGPRRRLPGSALPGQPRRRSPGANLPAAGVGVVDRAFTRHWSAC